MSEDTTYNGWKNYPTWCVNLWLANDQGLHDATCEQVASVLADLHPSSPYWTAEESYRYNVADALKKWLEDDVLPDLGASFSSDLLGWALAQVDWDEIADAWIETARDIESHAAQ